MNENSLNNSFISFLFQNKQNKIILITSLVAIIIQFITFKYFYPFASFIHGDSFSYITAAYKNSGINTYMIGYSKFLRLFSVFSTSDTLLVAFQYLFIQCSALFLLYTIFYLYTLHRTTKYILLAFMVFNPLFLHLSNLISSDCLFAALSLTWFSLLLWIIHYPNNKVIIWQAIVLFLAFTFRYNALIYPLISVIAFQISPITVRKKIIGLGLCLTLCGTFVLFTSYKYKKLTGYWQYSPFSGWQLSNNAMYIYRYVDRTERRPVPPKFRILDNMIREYFDSTRDTKRFPIEELQASTVYMWTADLSLYKYRNRFFEIKDSTAGEFKRWATMGPLYKKYGTYIIMHYPWHFIRYFIWPNFNKYYAPPVEFLHEYNSGKDAVTPQARAWFQYKSQIIKTRMKNNIVWILDFYPILSGVINVVLFFVLLFYFFIKGWQMNLRTKKAITLASVMWVLNAAFTISASSVALRFQTFPILLATVFVAILIDWLWKMAITVNPISNNKLTTDLAFDISGHSASSEV